MMIGKMVSLGFDLATLPARMSYRGAKTLLTMPEDLQQVMAEMREVSDEVAREIQTLAARVDAEMSQKAAHLSGEQKQQAAELALTTAGQHLSMAAVDMMRALWLTVDSSRSLQRDESPIIEQERRD